MNRSGFSRHRGRMEWLVLLSLLYLVPACAPFAGPPVPPPLTPADRDQLVTLLREQDQCVRSFFWSGRLTARKRLGEAENLIVSAGHRDPLRLKIEVTHSWGQPIFHALISQTEAKVLVVPEKRFYVGPMKGAGFSGDFLPAGLDPRQLWGALRGFPILPEYARVISKRGDQLTFLDSQGKVMQTVDFDPATRFPRSLSLPDSVVRVDFADIKDDQGVLFARHIIIESPDAGLTFDLEISQAIFNRPVPETIFSLNPPLGYEIHPLP